MRRKTLLIVLPLLLIIVFVSLFAFINQNKLIDRFISNQSEDLLPRLALLDKDGEMRLVTVGTGAPLPGNHRAGSCSAVFVNGQFLLFNVGPGAVRAMKRQRLPIAEIDAIFFSNLDTERTIDWSELEADLHSISTPSATEYPKVFMPNDSSRHTNIGRGELLPLDHTSTCQIIYTADSVSVMACAVDDLSKTYAYKVKYREHEIVIGAAYPDLSTMIELAAGVDYLLQDAYDYDLLERISRIQAEEGMVDQASIIQSAKQKVISKLQAAEIAAQANVKKLILTHLGPAPDNPISRAYYESDIDEIYPGSVILAEDGDLFMID